MDGWPEVLYRIGHKSSQCLVPKFIKLNERDPKMPMNGQPEIRTNGGRRLDERAAAGGSNERQPETRMNGGRRFRQTGGGQRVK